MFYKTLKQFIKKFPILWKLLTFLKDKFLHLSRIKDVFMMIFLFHIWPEQTYRFSTRKLLPSKKNKYSKLSKPTIPFDIIKEKSSNIQKMDEINIIAKGSSFDLKKLKELNGPIFLVSFWNAIEINKDGLLEYFYNADDFKSSSYVLPSKFLKDLISGGVDEKVAYNRMKEDKHFKFFTSYKMKPENSYFKKKNLSYVVLQRTKTKLIEKSENEILLIDVYGTDKFGNYFPLDQAHGKYNPEGLKNGKFKLISLSENIYKPPLLPPYANFTPTGSFLPALSALYNFANKINVYGWDFHLNSSPRNMSYWKLLTNMINIKDDFKLSKYHFESALINFYYAYQFSMLPNFNIHSNLGKLKDHERLIKKIERVLFN